MLGSSEISESGVKVGARLLKRYVLRGEQVEVATRQHWAVMIEPVLSVLGGFVLVSWITIQLDRMFGNAGGFLWVLWGMVLVRLLWKILEWRNEWFVATDKRLLLTYGLISHKVAMMPLGKVTDMTYDRSIVGRFLGYGTFLMESAGQDQALQRIRWVPSPDKTYRDICQIIFDPHSFDSDDSLPSAEPQKPPRDTRRGADERYSEPENDDWDDPDTEVLSDEYDDWDEPDDDRQSDEEVDGHFVADDLDDDSGEDLGESLGQDSGEDFGDDDWAGEHSTPAPPEDAGWQTSREGASTYQRVMPRKSDADDDDEDITGPIDVTRKGA